MTSLSWEVVIENALRIRGMTELDRKSLMPLIHELLATRDEELMKKLEGIIEQHKKNGAWEAACFVGDALSAIRGKL